MTARGVYWVKIFGVIIFWVKIFGVKMFWVKLGGPNRIPKGPEMAQNGHFGAIVGSGGCELMEQCKI